MNRASKNTPVHHHEHEQDSHSHAHHHHHLHVHGDASKNIAKAFFLNAFFVVVEIAGGIITNSIAILSDAVHDFGDCLSLGVAWGMQKKSRQDRDQKYTYGYKRYSLLGSLFLSGVLTVSSILIFIEGIKRLVTPEEIHATGMVWIAVFGILINGSAAFSVKKGSSLNERAVYLHIMEDVIGWVAVLLASITMLFVDFPYIDPILSLGISIWVFYHVVKNLRSIFRILLQGTPEDLDLDELKQDLASIRGIQSIHDLHVWSMDGESNVMTLHVVTEEKDTLSIKRAVLDAIREYHIDHVTMEFEQPGTDCLTSCDHCC